MRLHGWLVPMLALLILATPAQARVKPLHYAAMASAILAQQKEDAHLSRSGVPCLYDALKQIRNDPECFDAAANRWVKAEGTIATSLDAIIADDPGFGCRGALRSYALQLTKISTAVGKYHDAAHAFTVVKVYDSLRFMFASTTTKRFAALSRKALTACTPGH